MTLNEYLSMPEVVQPQELAFGVLHVRESPSPQHQRMVGQLFLGLHAHLRSHMAGEVLLAPLDVVLDRERALVVQPDLLVVTSNSACVVDDRVWGPPDVAIEVLSPMPRVGDLRNRLQWFATYGVRECWLVQQVEKWIEVIRFGDGDVVSRRRYARHEPIDSGVLPAFRESYDAIAGDELLA